jgi:hypothetical protein
MILLRKAAVEVRLVFLAFDSLGGVGSTLVPDLYEMPGCYDALVTTGALAYAMWGCLP